MRLVCRNCHCSSLELSTRSWCVFLFFFQFWNKIYAKIVAAAFTIMAFSREKTLEKFCDLKCRSILKLSGFLSSALDCWNFLSLTPPLSHQLRKTFKTIANDLSDFTFSQSFPCISQRPKKCNCCNSDWRFLHPHFLSLYPLSPYSLLSCWRQMQIYLGAQSQNVQNIFIPRWGRFLLFNWVLTDAGGNWCNRQCVNTTDVRNPFIESSSELRLLRFHSRNRLSSNELLNDAAAFPMK